MSLVLIGGFAGDEIAFGGRRIESGFFVLLRTFAYEHKRGERYSQPEGEKAPEIEKDENKYGGGGAGDRKDTK